MSMAERNGIQIFCPLLILGVLVPVFSQMLFMSENIFKTEYFIYPLTSGLFYISFVFLKKKQIIHHTQ